MKIEQKPAYFPLIQKPMNCWVTCLQMILFRRGYRFLQDDLAYELGQTAYKDNLKYFMKPLKIRSEDAPTTNTLEKVDAINSFFNKHKISLCAEAIYSSKIKDLKRFVIDNLRIGNDLWVELHNPTMYGSKGGHDNVVQTIDTEKETVTLIDPESYHKQIQEVSLAKLAEAIKKHDKERGFVIIKELNK